MIFNYLKCVIKKIIINKEILDERSKFVESIWESALSVTLYTLENVFAVTSSLLFTEILLYTKLKLYGCNFILIYCKQGGQYSIFYSLKKIFKK